MERNEIKFILSNSPPFSRLRPRQLEKLVNICEIKEYTNSEVIYRQGDSPDYLFFLLKGRVAVLTPAGGKETAIEILKRGTCFGIISLLTDDPHSVTAKSIETSFVLRVKKDEFKQFLKDNPLISLDFSRILSQRVKARFKPKRIFQSKKIGILDRMPQQRRSYLFDLGRELKKQTGKKVICLRIVSSPDTTAAKILSLGDFQEEVVAGYIISQETDVLYLTTDREDSFLSLLNFLSESYHFILYEIPEGLIDKSPDKFIVPAQTLHLVFLSQKPDLTNASALIKRLEAVDALSREKIKVILADPGRKDPLLLKAEKKALGQKVYATLPAVRSEDYFKALRRIAREAGEVILGVALGSGAAYGFSHIGVLKVLHEEGVAVDIICGSSMGAIVAGLWAAGFDFADIEKHAARIGKGIGRFSLSGFSIPFRGIVRARRLEHILRSVFADLTFQDLKHTLKIVVFNFLKRKTVVLEEGFLYKALAASCAFPGIFEPVRLKKEILLDGGILNPLPAEALLNYGVHKIIVSNITLSQDEVLREYKRRKQFHVLDFIFGSIETMQQQFIAQTLKVADVVIHPNLEGLGWTEFGRIAEFIKRGEAAAREKIAAIKALINERGV